MGKVLSSSILRRNITFDFITLYKKVPHHIMSIIMAAGDHTFLTLSLESYIKNYIKWMIQVQEK
jgi:hypothetical protein